MRNALRIVDDVSLRATWAMPDALVADTEAARNGDLPNNLINSLQTAAIMLAERTYLDLFDGYTTGRIGDEFDVVSHYDDMVLNFHNRIVSTLRFIPSLPDDWHPVCSLAIREAYTQRVRQLGMSNVGGWA